MRCVNRFGLRGASVALNSARPMFSAAAVQHGKRANCINEDINDMTDEFRSQIKDGVRYFLWMCVLTVIIGIAVWAILMPNTQQPVSQATPAQAIASAASAVSLDAIV